MGTAAEISVVSDGRVIAHWHRRWDGYPECTGLELCKLFVTKNRGLFIQALNRSEDYDDWLDDMPDRNPMTCLGDGSNIPKYGLTAYLYVVDYGRNEIECYEPSDAENNLKSPMRLEDFKDMISAFAEQEMSKVDLEHRTLGKLLEYLNKSKKDDSGEPGKTDRKKLVILQDEYEGNPIYLNIASINGVLMMKPDNENKSWRLKVYSGSISTTLSYKSEDECMAVWKRIRESWGYDENAEQDGSQ